MSTVYEHGTERTLHRETLKYAVTRQIFDKVTGDVLDVRRAVLVEVTVVGGGHAIEVMTVDRFEDAYGGHEGVARIVAELPAGSTIEVEDGRGLFGKVRGNVSWETYTAVAPAISAEQLGLALEEA